MQIPANRADHELLRYLGVYTVTICQKLTVIALVVRVGRSLFRVLKILGFSRDF